MPDNKIQEIADAADMIVAGYAFTNAENGFVRVLGSCWGQTPLRINKPVGVRPH